jgi:hypothetical protein
MRLLRNTLLVGATAMSFAMMTVLSALLLNGMAH